jgi:hypothetical protein
MNDILATAITTAASTLLASALAGYIALRMARSTRNHQEALEKLKRDADERKEARNKHCKDLADAHLLLSKLQREYSITSLEIVWNTNPSTKEYDARYLKSCELADELRAIAALALPQISPEVQSLYGNMNVFWGFFRQLLSVSSNGADSETKQLLLGKVHAAANQIGTDASHAKDKLATISVPSVYG